MQEARDVGGVVFQDGPVVLLARVTGADGAPIGPADVESVRYTITELDECDPELSAGVAGHEQVGLATNTVVQASLQVDPLWSVDADGYNFRHDVDISDHPAFPNARRLYQVRYELFPYVGQKVVFRFLLRAI